MHIVTQTEKETFDLGKKFAKELKGGEILALFGDLGAGKTTFSKGIAAGLGIAKSITSPTFNIMKIYPVDSEKIKRLVHVDAYRLSSSSDAESIGLLELITDPHNIIVVEWPENIWDAIKADATKIDFKFVDETRREING